MTMSTSTRQWLKSPPLCWFREDLTGPNCTLIQRGDEHSKAEEWAQAIGCFEDAIAYAERKRDRRTKGSALIHLAEVYRACRKMDDALRCYKDAIGLFKLLGDDHNRAVACRMAATLCHNPSQCRQALGWYEEALEILSNSCQRHTELGNHSRAAQYRAWCRDILMRIEEAQALYQPKAKSKVRPLIPKTKLRAGTRKPHDEEMVLQLMPVLGQIPAGVPLYVLLDAKGDYVGCAELLIDDTPYQIQSLRGRTGTRVRIEKGFNYFVLKVKGDSMIQAGIEEGDYVIMKGKGEEALDPKDGDIVAALIKNQDDEATLKRFRRIDRHTIVLEPENPDYPPFEFTEGDPEVQIMGIAIAILKRVDEEAS